jgi:hypothetical protein
MRRSGLLVLLLLPLAVSAGSGGAEPAAPVLVPAGANDPVLRLEAGGPLGPIVAVAFGPDGRTLYEAGSDKVVRVWRRDPETGRFRLDARATLRVPIGPDEAGYLNALAVSADGHWLATAGSAVFPGGAGFHERGLYVPRTSVADPLAQGTIYVFDLRSSPPSCRQLRGHRGFVVGLAFARAPEGRSPVLLSAGAESSPESAGRLSLMLRLWDIDAQKPIDAVLAGSYGRLRPWLAIWPTAPPAHRYRSVVAWGDHSFLVWDLGDRVPRFISDPYKDGRSRVLTYQPDQAQGRLLTGHIGYPPPGAGNAPGGGGIIYPEGFLNAWDAATFRGAGSRILTWRSDLPAVKGTPAAVAVVSSRPGAHDLLAVVLQSWTPPSGADASGLLEYRLQLLELASTRFGELKAHASLWKGPRVQPFVAAASDGARLAVIGNPENEVLVLTVDDLLRGRSQPERLSGEGEPIQSVSFVRKGLDWGFRIKGKGDAALLFDVANRRITPDSGGWTPADAALGEWQTLLVDAQPADRPGGDPIPARFWVYHRQQPRGPGITIRSDSVAGPAAVQVTAHALLPPGPRGRLADPIAALALEEPWVVPTLWLYDVRSGVRFRRLTGHTGRIRSLAFSADHRFLVSTADDRTACLWSLTDLDKVLGTRGALPGLVLSRRDDGSFVVDRVQGASASARVLPGRDDLRAGDVIEGLLEGPPGQARLRVPSSVSEFYLTVSTRRPGESLTLRRRGRERPRDVVLTLGQACDERKPLATLFLAKPDEWLAWNPSGPYDSSGERAAALFGWHFNRLERPEAPTQFALAADPAYQFNRREGLLRALLEWGELPPPPAPAGIESADLTLFLEPDEPGANDLVRHPPTRLGLALADRTAPAQVASVHWRLDNGPAQAMEADARDYLADLSPVTWDRQAHVLSVTVQPAQATVASIVKQRTVRYVPLPPQLDVRSPQERAARSPAGLKVTDRSLPLAVTVAPEQGVTARARLIHRHDGKILREDDFGPDFTARPIAVTLTLKPGVNWIDLEAHNEGATDATRGLETTALPRLKIDYQPRLVEKPRIQLATLTLLPEEPELEPAATARTIALAGSGPVVVTVPRVRLGGLIMATDKLLRAQWQRPGEEWKSLDGFIPRALGRFDVHHELELKPGPQRVLLRAAAGNDESPEAVEEVSLDLDYQPPLPRVLELAAEPRGPVVIPGTAGEAPRVRLTARIVGTPERFPLETAAVLSGDEPLPAPPTIDRTAGIREGRLTADVPLRRGINMIGIAYRNRWSRERAHAGPITVEYLRPPLVEPLELKAAPDRALAAVAARVHSLTPLGRVLVYVERDPAGEPASRPLSAGWTRAGADGSWNVSAEVPLEPGENTVIVRAWNDDGRAEVRGTIRYDEPPKPPPIGIVETPERIEVQRPRAPLRFRILSDSPLQRVALSRLSASAPPVFVQEFPVAAAGRGPDGRFALAGKDTDIEVALEPGQNCFQLAATNAGGMWSTNLVFTYVPPPVEVAIDAVETQTESGQELQVDLRSRPGDRPLDRPLAIGVAALRGRVIGNPVDGSGPGNDPLIEVRVNGFSQVAVRPGPAVAAAERAPGRPFRAEILLTSPENTIEFRLNGAPLDINHQPELTLACKKPERTRRLHLWVIGIGVDDADALTQRAIQALGGRDYNKNERTFTTPAFSSASVYGPDCPSLHPNRLFGRLYAIREAVKLRPRPSEDLVVIFYQGGEVIETKSPSASGEGVGDPGEPCLRLRPATGMETDLTEEDIIRVSEIRKRLRETRGAKLLILDVSHARDEGPMILSRSSQWSGNDSPFGLLRFSWPSASGPTAAAVPAPPDAGLVVPTTLQAAVQRAATLEQVKAEVVREFSVARRRDPSLDYSPELNRAFKQLVIGGQ